MSVSFFRFALYPPGVITSGTKGACGGKASTCCTVRSTSAVSSRCTCMYGRRFTSVQCVDGIRRRREGWREGAGTGDAPGRRAERRRRARRSAAR